MSTKVQKRTLIQRVAEEVENFPPNKIINPGENEHFKYHDKVFGQMSEYEKILYSIKRIKRKELQVGKENAANKIRLLGIESSDPRFNEIIDEEMPDEEINWLNFLDDLIWKEIQNRFPETANTSVGLNGQGEIFGYDTGKIVREQTMQFAEMLFKAASEM